MPPNKIPAPKRVLRSSSSTTPNKSSKKTSDGVPSPTKPKRPSDSGSDQSSVEVRPDSPSEESDSVQVPPTLTTDSRHSQSRQESSTQPESLGSESHAPSSKDPGPTPGSKIDLAKITKWHIPKPVGRPKRQFPPIGGAGPPSYYPLDQRLIQKQLKEEDPPHGHRRKDYSNVGKKYLPARLDPDSATSQGELYRTTDKIAAKANEVTAIKPYRRNKEATLLDEWEDDEDIKRRNNKRKKLVRTDEQKREDHGMTPEMWEQYKANKTKEREIANNLKKFEEEAKERRAQQFQRLKDRSRHARSRSVDILDKVSPKSKDKGSPPSSRGRSGRPITADTTKQTSLGSYSPPPMLHSSSPGKTVPPPKSPSPGKTVPPPKLTNAGRHPDAYVANEGEKKIVDTFPKQAAQSFYKNSVKIWDAGICDKVGQLVDRIYLEYGQDDDIPKIQITDEFEAFLDETNAPPALTIQQKNKVSGMNNITQDMFVGLISCILEEIYSRSSSSVRPRRDEGETEEQWKLRERQFRGKVAEFERAKRLLNPNEVTSVLFPVLRACLAQLSGDPPFLKDAWLKKYLTPKTTARFRGPGYRLPPHWDTTAFPTIHNLENKTAWRSVGTEVVDGQTRTEYQLLVVDGKSLYPKKSMTDAAFGACLCLKIKESQLPPVRKPDEVVTRPIGHYISPEILETLYNLLSRNDEAHYNEQMGSVTSRIAETPRWDLFFAPLHFRGLKHWLMVVGHSRNQTLEIFDPFQPSYRVGNSLNYQERDQIVGMPPPEENEITLRLNIVKTLLEGVTGLNWCRGQNLLEMTYVRLEDIPVQHDDYACGPLCLCFVELRLEDPRFLAPDNRANMDDPGSGLLNLRLFRELDVGGNAKGSAKVTSLTRNQVTAVSGTEGPSGTVNANTAIGLEAGTTPATVASEIQHSAVQQSEDDKSNNYHDSNQY